MDKFGLPIAVVAVVGAMIGLFMIGGGGEEKAAKEVERIGTKHEVTGEGNHIQPGQKAEYKTNLPSSGAHYPTAAPWGVKDQQLPDETVVHNLEHGGIWIAYKPDLPKDDVERLKEIFNDLPNSQFGSIKAILMPRETNTKPVQLAAWGYTLDMDNVDEEKIRQFYEGHVDKGPELVP